ncbi:MAG: tonB-system energizer ExbB [Rhodospirillaceae bacterium]
MTPLAPEIAALSPWEMFVNADAVVQTVMGGLFLASLATWTIALAQGVAIRSARRRLRALLCELGRCDRLPESRSDVPEAEIVAVVRLEREHGDAGVRERAELAVGRVVAGCVRRLRGGTGVLATIGATAPFVGLFGTVWGIMNSFVGIAESHTTNLAVVAPGIAEALLATAFGLVAAIPAVVIYNLFARALAAYRAELEDLAALTLRLLGRGLADRDVHKLAAE